jgi:hypothetical protein
MIYAWGKSILIFQKTKKTRLVSSIILPKADPAHRRLDSSIHWRRNFSQVNPEFL